MSLHNWRRHWRVYLLDKDLVPIQPLRNLVGLKWTWALFDECEFTASVPVTSRDYGYLDPEADQLLWIQRLDKAQVFAIQYLEMAWKMRRGRKERVVNIAGMGGAKFFLSRRIIQPAESAYVDTITNQPYDDAILQLIANQGGASAYDDPDSDGRQIIQMTTAAKKSEAANYGEDIDAASDNLWDAVKSLCEDSGTDLTYTPTWNGPDSAVTFQAATHYGGRGADNGVILSDRMGVLIDSKWWRDKYDLKTHAYTEDGQTIMAASDAASHLRAEMRVKSAKTRELRRALVANAEKRGHTFGFRETRGAQLGVDFWLGDTIQHHDSTYSTDVLSELLAGVEIEIQDDGSERIQLTLGDLKPNTARDRGGGGGGSSGLGREREVPAGVSFSDATGLQVHDIVGDRHTVTGSALQIVGVPSSNTLGLLTPSSDVSAGTSAILKSDSSGYLTVAKITAAIHAITATEYLDANSGNLRVYASAQMRLKSCDLGIDTGYGIWHKDATSSKKLLVWDGSRFVPDTLYNTVRHRHSFSVCTGYPISSAQTSYETSYITTGSAGVDHKHGYGHYHTISSEYTDYWPTVP